MYVQPQSHSESFHPYQAGNKPVSAKLNTHVFKSNLFSETGKLHLTANFAGTYSLYQLNCIKVTTWPVTIARERPIWTSNIKHREHRHPLRKSVDRFLGSVDTNSKKNCGWHSVEMSLHAIAKTLPLMAKECICHCSLGSMYPSLLQPSQHVA